MEEIYTASVSKSSDKLIKFNELEEEEKCYSNYEQPDDALV